MQLAVYFSAGAQSKVTPHHYALNVPLYTHFTSPIRRYADVMVHRQLAAALGQLLMHSVAWFAGPSSSHNVMHHCK